MAYHKKEDNLLFEAYCKIINERASANTPAANTPVNVVPASSTKQAALSFEKARNGDYASYIQWLKKHASEPEVNELLNSGDGNTDKLEFSSVVSIKVSQFIPCQNEIDIDGSLNFPLTVPATFQKYVQGKDLMVGKPPGAPVLAYTLDGTTYYIVDGHHRWSQVYCINPEATIATTVIKPGKQISPIEMLKAVQTAIAAVVKTVKISGVDGKNLLTRSPQDIISYVIQKLTNAPAVLQTAQTLKYAPNQNGVTDINSVAQKIANNCAKLASNNKPISGAPSRTVMPQTGKDDLKDFGANASDVVKTKASAGAIDVIYNPIQQPTS